MKHIGGETLGQAKSVSSKVRKTGSDGIGTVKNIGSGTRDQAKSVKDKLSNRFAERKLRRREGEEEPAAAEERDEHS